MNAREKLVHLCDLVSSGEASAEEIAELEDLLRENPSARQVYLDWAALHVDLASIVSISRQRTLLAEKIQTESTVSPTPRSASWWAALAASVLFAFVFGAWYLSAGPDSDPVDNGWRARQLAMQALNGDPIIDGMAVVSRIENVSWSAEGQAFLKGDLLKSHDWLMIDAGTLEIEFGQGAVVVLQGPAKFSARSTSQGVLDHGKLAAVVPPWADGFRIDTPAFEVVDRGTQFVVEVSPDQVNVGVTKGEVEITNHDQPELSENIEFRHSLLAGKAVRAWSGNLLETALDNRWSSLSEELPARPGHDDVQVVAKYRRDFIPGVANEHRREGNWRYFANHWTPVENTEGYVELKWDSKRKLFDPNGDKRRKAGSRLGAANLSYRGGHPGQGRDQTKDDVNHYVIAAYQVSEPGAYRIESGWLVRAESREDNEYQSVDLRVRVNDRPDAIAETCNRDGLLRFQGELGRLKKGDWIYVAVGPQGVSFNDRFEWDFAIVKSLALVTSI